MADRLQYAAGLALLTLVAVGILGGLLDATGIVDLSAYDPPW